MSRKIVMNRGFENVLYRKPKKQASYYSVYETSGANEWERIEKHIAKVGNRKAFLGIGLCAGELRQQSRKRNVAAPLLFAPIEIGTDDESRKLFEYVDWEGLCFNYDLISILITSREEEEEPQTQQSNFYSEEKESYQKFSELEMLIEDKVNDGDTDDFLTETFCTEIFDNMAQSIQAFKSMKKDIDTKPNEENLTSLLNECMKHRQLSFFNHRFVFIANTPDELTAYTALRELLKQVE